MSINPLAQSGDLQESRYITREVNAGNACMYVTGTIALALFIIGCLAVAGQLSGVVAGGFTVGFAATMLLIMLYRVCCADSVMKPGEGLMAVIAIAIVILGALTIPGIVKPAIVGWVNIATVATSASLLCATCCWYRIWAANNYQYKEQQLYPAALQM